MHIFWWYQGLKPVIATATALDPPTNAEYTDLADAQNAAVAVENISMPGPAATSNLDGNRTYQQHRKGKFVHQAQPADHVRPQHTRPAAANKWTKGSAPSTQNSNGYKASPFGPSTLADQTPALLACMTSHGNSPAPIPHAPQNQAPRHLLGQGLHWSWPYQVAGLPKTAAYFTDNNGPGPMDTTAT
ncbi:hypothetical protein WJX77_009872 [Trebouxia sp. C0004]